MEKVALITGSYRGLGLETAKQLLALGYRVVISSRSDDKGLNALNELHANNAYYHQLDITDIESIEHCMSWIKSKFNRLDVLINNAGINYDTWHNAVNADLNQVAKTMDSNFMGAWRMAQAAIPLMQQNKYGRIVNVSSGAGAINGMGGGTPGYSASKAAMNVFTIKLASDLEGSGILVNSVCPGWVRTEMGGSAAPRSVEEGAKGIVWAATLDTSGPNGGFFRDGKRIDW